MGDTERFLPEGGGGGPLRAGGLHPGTGSADGSSRTNSTSGWTPVAPRSASSRRRAMLRPKGRILYDSSEGVPGNPAKGTRLRSSGRCSGICRAAPRDYQAQSQLTCSGEPSCEAHPLCGGRIPPTVRRGRLRLPAGRRGAPGGSRSASTRQRAMLRSKGRILYELCEGVPENPAKGTRLRSSGRCSGACPAAPRDYQAQSQLTCSAERRVAKRARCAGDAGRRAGTGSADRSSRGTSTSGRTPGAPGRSRSASLDGALCSDPRAASSTIVRRGAWKPSPKGLDSGRAAGRAVPVRRPRGTTRRSPNSLPRRSRVAKRGRRADDAGGDGATAPGPGGGMADPEWFSRRVAEEREAASPRRSPAGDGFRHRWSRATSTSGWMPGGLREGRGPHPLDGALCSASRAASSTTRAKGCLETQRKGLDSGRVAGRAVPVRRPHGTTRRSPNSHARRSRVAKRGRRAGDAGGDG